MSDGPEAPPRNAATVILLRDSAAGPQVFMMERHVKSDFVGGAYVFPGGRVDEGDLLPDRYCAGLDDAQASRLMHLSRGGMAYYVAAIRECFEEAGVLLAYDDDGQLLDFDEPAIEDDYRTLRDRLNAGEVEFAQLVRDRDLRLATDLMHYWAHWITPEGAPRRYDTRFFLAAAPPRQTATHDDWELTNSAWVTPQEALDKAESKQWMIIFPTLRNLMQLRDFTDVEQAETAARRRGEVETLQPRLIKTEGGIQAVLPGDPGWDDAPDGSEEGRRFLGPRRPTET